MRCDSFDQAFVGPTVDSYPGLTKREYFAAQALVGCVASGYSLEDGASDFAAFAVACADALIKELNK